MIYYSQRYVLYIFMATLCLSLFISISYAVDNEAGKILLTRGKVTVKRSAAEYGLKRGSALFAKDEVHVGPNGRVQFRMADNAVISLQENSVFKINKYSYKKDKKTDNAFYELLSGGLRTVTGAIGKGNKKAYELKTPLAKIGVRGTLFEVEIVGNDTYIAEREGQIFTISTISGCSLSLNAGQFLHISPSGCRILREDQLPSNLSLFATGHSSAVRTNDPEDSVNLNILEDAQGNIIPDMDDVNRQSDIITDFTGSSGSGSGGGTGGSSTGGSSSGINPGFGTEPLDPRIVPPEIPPL